MTLDLSMVFKFFIHCTPRLCSLGIDLQYSVSDPIDDASLSPITGISRPYIIEINSKETIFNILLYTTENISSSLPIAAYDNNLGDSPI